MVITFEEFRKIKDSLPEGSVHEIAETCQVHDETVRNYFGGTHYDTGDVMGVHFEQGPKGGVVRLDDPSILECAKAILKRQESQS